jgi:putative 4-mercaptohistidine N1-methyltranferase
MVSPPLLPRRADQAALAACHARYESDAAVAQYCDAHYGPDKFGVPNFPAQLAQRCIAALAGGPRRRALDLGCAVGRASFELATRFDQVAGIDFSTRFIAIANRLKERGRFRYQLAEEGELISEQEVFLADLGLTTTAPRVAFYQGDVQQLEPHVRDFDLVLAANLIDRLADPKRFLAGIHRRLVIGGLLAIASPYNWLEEYTPKPQWLGGRFRAGTPLTNLEGLREKLAGHFVAVGEPQEVELVLRETARKFQFHISQLTFWRRVR